MNNKKDVEELVEENELLKRYSTQIGFTILNRLEKYRERDEKGNVISLTEDFFPNESSSMKMNRALNQINEDSKYFRCTSSNVYKVELEAAEDVAFNLLNSDGWPTKFHENMLIENTVKRSDGRFNSSEEIYGELATFFGSDYEDDNTELDQNILEYLDTLESRIKGKLSKNENLTKVDDSWIYIEDEEEARVKT